MALEVLTESHQGYSPQSRRSLIGVVGRRALGLVNGSTSHLLVRPFVVMAARALGPGPTRLRLVKLAHTLDHDALSLGPGGLASGLLIGNDRALSRVAYRTMPFCRMCLSRFSPRIASVKPNWM